MSDQERNTPDSSLNPRQPEPEANTVESPPGQRRNLLSKIAPESPPPSGTSPAKQSLLAPTERAAPAPPPDPPAAEEFPKVSPFVSDPLELEDEVAEAIKQAPPPSSLREKVRKVEDAIRNLRVKMAAIAIELAEGRVNQAQFEAIYNRFQEQRAITESLLARDPDSEAWQHVLSEGSTGFLRQKYEAELEGYVLYLNKAARPIVRHGEIKVDSQSMMDTLKRLRAARRTPGVAQCAPVAGERWLVYVPGRQTTAIAVYENEPPTHQLQLIGDLHRDFETANREKLAAEEPFSPQTLVYPQRSLFEQD